MNNEISFMIKIQEIDDGLSTLEGNKEKFLSDMENARQALSEKELELAKLKDELLEIEKKIGGEELNIKTYDDKINKMKEAQKLIKTNKEFNAMQKSTRDNEALKAKCEEELISYLGAKETLDGQISGVMETTRELAGKLEEMEKQYRDNEEGYKKTKDDFVSKRQSMSSRVKPEYFKVYESIKKTKKFPIITSVADSGACTGCYRVLPPQQYNELLSGKVFMQCPVCSRIIYIEKNLSSVEDKA